MGRALWLEGDNLASMARLAEENAALPTVGADIQHGFNIVELQELHQPWVQAGADCFRVALPKDIYPLAALALDDPQQRERVIWHPIICSFCRVMALALK